MKSHAAAALILLSLTECRPADPLLSVVRTTECGGIRLALVAAPGGRINARLRPALEFGHGGVLRFDGTNLTPDSSYYTAPPELRIAGPLPRVGLIRASVCPAGESVCRLVTIALRTPPASPSGRTSSAPCRIPPIPTSRSSTTR